MKLPYRTYRRAEDLACAIFNRCVRAEINAAFSGVFFGKLKIRLEAGHGNTSYTYSPKPGQAVIFLSLNMACAFAGVEWNKPVAENDTLSVAKLIKLGLEGFAYHEMGHLRYTDMSGEGFDAIPKKYRWAEGYIHEVSNVLEDPTEEKAFSSVRYYRFTKALFRMIVKRIFRPQAANYVDDGSMTAFLQYVLLYLRCGPKAIASNNATFDALVPKGLLDKIREAHRERDSKERCRKQIALAIWLIDELGLKPTDVAKQQNSTRPVIILVDKRSDGTQVQTPLQPEDVPLPPVSIAEAGNGGDANQQGETPDADIIDMRKHKDAEPSDGSQEAQAGTGESEEGEADEAADGEPGGEGAGGDEGETDAAENAEGPEGEDGGVGSSTDQSGGNAPETDDAAAGESAAEDATSGDPAGTGDGPTSSKDAKGDFDWDVGDDDPLEAIAEETAVNSYDPDLDRALRSDATIQDGEFSFNAVSDYDIEDLGRIASCLEEGRMALGSLTGDLADALKAIKAESAPHERHWLPSGEEIDIGDFIDSRASNTPTMDLYRDEEPGREITDLAVALLVDCSGSMDGENSQCAYLASLMVASACEESDIPTHIAAFSDRGILNIKGFDDEDDVWYDYLGLLNDRLSTAYGRNNPKGVKLWGGTDCESALALLLNEIEKYDEKKHKLVFVITDGNTGDPRKVGALVQGAREEGTIVIGIGIDTSLANLKACFDHYKSFTTSSLGSLPGYVADEIEMAIESDGFAGY